jgi:anti-sigma B factor antagonist
MSTEIVKKEEFTVVKLNSVRLDTNNASELKSEFLFLHNNGENNIVLDLSSCKYCDSSGLRAILVGNRLCEDSIGTFIVCGLQPDVEHLIRISMLHTVLLIVKNLEQAEDLIYRKKEM